MGEGQNIADKLFEELDFEPKFRLKEERNGSDTQSKRENSSDKEV